MAKQEGLLVLRGDVAALTERIDKLERSTDNRFTEILGELKEIRDEIKEVNCRADIVGLQLRVKKLEKKVGMR
jgi:hypothetical protein